MAVRLATGDNGGSGLVNGGGNTLSGILKPGKISVPGLGVVNAPAPAAAAPTYQAPAAAQQALGGGGGGGGGAAAAAPVAAPVKPSLSDYINSNFLYQQAQGQGNDALANYDAATTQGQQATQAEQALKDTQLQQSLGQAGQASADSLAAHGLLDSGVNFQNQDKIDQGGVVQQNAIDSLLTNFLQGRQTGRLNQQQANNTALNGIMNQLTQQYNGQAGAAI